MEAATPLRHPSVHTLGDRLSIEGLVVDDECAVRLVREREEAGDDPAATVTDAIEIGARVLDREQAAANAEYVKTEFERTAKEVEHDFTEQARGVVEEFERKVDQVFGPDNGHMARELEKLFSDGSSASVQNRVREIVGEAMTKSRQDLVRQFSSADGSNPLADFKAHMLDASRKAEQRQHATQQALLQRLGELEKHLEALRVEKQQLEQLDAERERGTAKGRSFEEQVVEAVDAIASAQGDDVEGVGDLKGATGKAGDAVVAIGGCQGPPQGRIVVEAKDRRLSRRDALEELDRAMAERDADFALLVVPGEEEIPAKLHELREYNGDKLVVTLDPQLGSRLALELGYRLARARVLMARGGGEEIDAGAVRDTVQRALQAMEDVRRVKTQLTGAKTGIDKAYALVEEMAERVRAQLDAIDQLVAADADEPGQQPLSGLD
jgi:predicted metal-dependent phosphoesterase TrpH